MAWLRLVLLLDLVTEVYWWARCPHDPRVFAGQPIGMYHCPFCAQMVVAGLEHHRPVFDAAGRLLEG